MCSSPLLGPCWYLPQCVYARAERRGGALACNLGPIPSLGTGSGSPGGCLCVALTRVCLGAVATGGALNSKSLFEPQEQRARGLGRFSGMGLPSMPAAVGPSTTPSVGTIPGPAGLVLPPGPLRVGWLQLHRYSLLTT